MSVVLERAVVDEGSTASDAVLFYRDASGRQQITSLPAAMPRLTIGRGMGSDLQLSWDHEVSRLHAQLEQIGNQWVLDDDGLSRNGTYVNSERLQTKRRLRDGDVIFIGSTTMTYHDGQRAAASETRAAQNVVTTVPVSPDSATRDVPSRLAKRLTLLAMCFGLFMAMLDNTIVNVALPSIQASVDASVSGLEWVVTAYTLPFACLLLTAGLIGDVKGRKRVFMAGLVLFTAASAACALAPDMTVLVIARCVQGAAAAALFPSTLSIIRHTFSDPRERAQAIGIWAGVAGIAIAAGPVLGGVLVDSLGWQSVFLMNVPIGIIGLIVGFLFVVESKDPEGRRLDLPGQVLAIAAVGSLTYALIEGSNLGWGSIVIVTLFIVAGASLVHFLVVEARTASPMLQLKFFADRVFATANVVAFLLFFGLFGVLFFISLFLQNVQDYSPVQAGIHFLPATLSIALTAPIAGKLSSRFGSPLPMASGLTMMGIGTLSVGGISADSAYSSYWWALALVGIGVGLTMTPMTAAVMAAVPPERAGMASATTTTSREIGGVFGIALLGALVTGQMRTSLDTSLLQLGVPDQTRTALVDAATQGGAGHDAGQVPGLDAALLKTLSNDAFVQGLQVACTVAGIALLIGAVLAMFGMRPQRLPSEGRHRRV